MPEWRHNILDPTKANGVDRNASDIPDAWPYTYFDPIMSNENQFQNCCRHCELPMVLYNSIDGVESCSHIVRVADDMSNHDVTSHTLSNFVAIR